MFDRRVAALFPLPLSTFERYMLSDDRPDYPMVFAIQLKFSGEIDRPAFESSFEEALSRHPLLCALVRRRARAGPEWVLAEDRRPAVDWNAAGAAVGTPCGERIDLGSEVGLRVWARQGAGATELTLQFHHACCDGIGALRFIGHVLAAYGARTAPADRRPALQPCDPAALLGRGEFTVQAPARGSRAARAWSSVRDGVRWVCRRPAILRGADGDGGGSTLRHTFDAAQSRAIRQAGMRRGVTVNDLLLRDMFQTLCDWNARQASGAGNRWLRIAVPVSLRASDAARMPAANGLSYTFLTRHGSRCGDSQALLESIRRETDVTTRRRRAAMFLRGFQLMERIPGALPLYLGRNRCFATVVLSYLGDPVRQMGARFPRESGKIVVGNLILEEIFGAPPIRPNTRAGLSISAYAGNLCVCLRCDPHWFTAADAQRLLSLYVARLRRTMAEAG